MRTSPARRSSVRKLMMSATPVCILVSFLLLTPGLLTVQPPIWIWSADQVAGQVPAGTCYFRKSIFIKTPKTGQLSVYADDHYELFVNGKRVGEGDSWETATVHDVSDILRSGENLVALKVTNQNGSTAGLAAKITIETETGQRRNFISNSTWKTNLRALPLWQNTLYNDKRWDRAVALGRVGSTKPWIASDKPADSVASQPGKLSKVAKTKSKSKSSTKSTTRQPRAIAEVDAAKAMTEPQKITQIQKITNIQQGHESGESRFLASEGFRIERITNSQQTGSLIAMTFTEFGDILASVENGPLLRVYDTNKNGIPDAVNTCCHKVTNCQGLVSISGNAIVVGDGPAGTGVYRLIDKDRDGIFESVSSILAFKDKMSEHGPHGLTLGPDGMLYLVVGNEAEVQVPLEPSSPYRNTVDGDLAEPRFEDPGGHAVGRRGHGGTIIRLDPEGKRVELFAGGIRNAYDLAFTQEGELVVHDSDMEADDGLPWHRPTRLLHVTAGAEFGWRSGWAKWPDDYLDTLPGVLDTGRASPTGIVLYDHDQFPEKYRGALFTCDWTRGEIVALRVKLQGAQLVAEPEVVLQGKPLNVTDIAVGSQGSLYFCTGGRGTQGEIFRLVWNKADDKRSPKPSETVPEVVRRSHLHTSWGRQLAAESRVKMGDQWG